jgi:hypothetical protein
MINRQMMAYAFMVFILIWYAGILIAVKYLGVSVMEGVGLGTAGGVFVGSFKDMWQFLWRTASPQEKALGAQPPVSPPPPIEPSK